MCDIIKSVWSLISDQTFLNAIGSALGGFLGAIIFFKWRMGLEKKRKQPILIQTYLPGESEPNGEGTLTPRLGEKVTHAARLSELGFSEKSVLLLKKDDLPPSTGGERFVFFGPYNADLNRVGRFKIGFEIVTRGFNTQAEYEVLQSVILRLDVLRLISVGSQNTAQDVFAIQYIKYRELAEASEGKRFELDVYSPGTGIWEYRAQFPDNIYKLSDSIRSKLGSFEIYFVNITVTYLPEIQYPW